MMVLNSHGMKSKIMHEIIEKCRVIADTRKPVLIIGEFGSGKGWIAKTIHELGYRKNQPFSKINCNSMQSDEIKRKLFGHLSFQRNRSVEINRGLFEKCNEGTLFFEGFEALDVNLQQQIIDSIQSKSINHIGSSLSIITDVRMIASVNGYTHQINAFPNHRENSIYEINPHIIFLPPLRNRREDIAPLIYSFLDSNLFEEPGMNTNEISPEVLYLCMHYSWPGNIRQLKNVIKLGVLLSNGYPMLPEHLPKSILTRLPKGQKLFEVHQSKSFQKAEKNLIRDLLHKINSPEKIATSLGIKQQKLEEKIEKYQLHKAQTES